MRRPLWARETAACVVSLSVFGALLCGQVPNADARKMRRERERYECRPSQEPANLDVEKAKRLWESGTIYYDSKEYQKAKTEFQNAYDISHLPDFLINLAQTSAKLDQKADAVKYLEMYVQECPGAPDAPLARQRIDDLRIAMAIQEGNKPPPAPLRLPPKPAMALLGSGAVLLIVGAGLGGGAIAAGQQVGNAANHNMVFNPDLQNAERRGRALESAAIAFDVLGALALVGGAAWSLSWVYEQKTGISLALAPRPGGFALSGRF